MTIEEFSDQFDVLYNNITSNRAPGLNEYEKSLFLTKAEKEIVKNYFSAGSKGNLLGQGFDDSAKRQADFSVLMKTAACSTATLENTAKIDSRSYAFNYPTDVFIVINETVKTVPTSNPNASGAIKQVIPLRYDEYTRLMSKPFKRPVKNQVWRLINKGIVNAGTSTKTVEIVTAPGEQVATNGYIVRYVRTPSPIIVADLDGLTIDGVANKSTQCDLDPTLHDDVLQRAVELAKAAWTATGQDNIEATMNMGQRVE